MTADKPQFLPYRPARKSLVEMREAAASFERHLDSRRSVRHFSGDPVPRELIEAAIRTASTAPSGAHRQPWTFVAISDPAVKHEIRLAAEAEERETYANRMSDEWREALHPLGTDANKPFLDIVPWIVVVFEQRFGIAEDGRQLKHFYVRESVGIACGMFIAALHNMGLATLTHTPSPMGFLSRLLGRPAHERPTILFPIGYPATDAVVPNLRRKTLDEVAVFDPVVADTTE